MVTIAAGLAFLVLGYFIDIYNLGGTCLFVDVVNIGPYCFALGSFIPHALRYGAFAVGALLIGLGVNDLRRRG